MAREMKDSGVEWIGKIPSSWDINKIKNNFTIVSGATPKSENPDFWDGSIPWITPADYKTQDKYVSCGRRNLSEEGYNSCGTTLIPAGSIVFSKRAPVGTVAITQAILCTNQGCLSCVSKNVADSTYYYYAMSVFTEQFELVSAGTTFKEISADVFANFPIPHPPLEEQKVISSFLDSQCARIDAVIEKTHASIEEYKKLKQAVITQAVTKGIRPGRDMKDSGVEWIGDAPNAWTILSLKYLCSMQAGKNLVSEQISESGEFPVYGGNGLRGYFIDYNCEGKYLLVGRQGALCGNVHRVEGQFWATEHAVITKNSDLCDMDYLYYLLIGMNLNQYVSSTAAQPGLAVSTIQNVRTCLPPLHEQKEIASYLDNKIDEIQMLTEKKESFLMELNTYKKSIIFEYVTGKKEVH